MKKSLLLLALLAFWGCGNSSRYESGAEYESQTVEYEMIEEKSFAASNADTSESVAEAVPTVGQARRIIKTGRMGIRVARIDEAKRHVDSLLERYRGYYSEENSNDGYRSGLTLTIRLPQERFDAFTAALESGGGELLYKNISARDVGEEYVDTEIRLANKLGYLERYREILRRATTIGEILEVEQYIRRIEEEIESARGRLRYLDNQTAYSTLELTLSTENIPVPGRNTFWRRLKRAFSSGWDGIVSFVIGLIYLWPFLLIGGVVLALIRWRIKRRKEQKERKAPDPSR